MADKVVEMETVKIGDTFYNKDDISPSAYFEYVKGLKKKLNQEEYSVIIDRAIEMINKTKITGQTEMAKRITHQLDLALKELDCAKKGFDIFVNRKDIEKYISSVDKKCIKIIELSRYTRDIPDEIMDKLILAKEIFDEIYVIFTDYTMKETKKVAKERRDKDPILFGAFLDPDGKADNKIYVEDRLFFIADWVEEMCDLTLEEIVRNTDDVKTYKIPNVSDIEAAKKFLDSFNAPIDDMEPVTLFEKVKKKATRKKSASTTTKKPKAKKSTKKDE